MSLIDRILGRTKKTVGPSTTPLAAPGSIQERKGEAKEQLNHEQPQRPRRSVN